MQWWRDLPLSTASPTDWLDIFILTWLIYRVLSAIQGTRALQTLLVVGLLVAVYALADMLGLSTLQWLFDKLSIYLILVVIILFQDDIRRAVARAGGRLIRTTGQTDANTLEEIIRGVFNLASRKVGALVCLERTASLSPYAEGAHQLDARISAELLQSIFHPSSPFHDGAVLIDGSGRVRTAGAFLPLSTAKNVARIYGTRHRAAVGLTEETDAIVLVVSEERGTVSMVVEGQVVPVADANDLRQRISEMLRPRAEPEEAADE